MQDKNNRKIPCISRELEIAISGVENACVCQNEDNLYVSFPDIHRELFFDASVIHSDSDFISLIGIQAERLCRTGNYTVFAERLLTLLSVCSRVVLQQEIGG